MSKLTDAVQCRDFSESNPDNFERCCHVQPDGSIFQSAPDENSVRISGFIGDSIVDGPGLRSVIFTQGCPHHCAGCHNPQTHPFSGGSVISIDELFEKINSYRLTSGVTFSGGEPFCQAAPLSRLAEIIKNNKLELAIYTGFSFEQLIKSDCPDVRNLLAAADVLIDGHFIMARRNLTLRFRGSDNQRIIDVKKSLEAGKVICDTSDRWNGN